MAATDEMVKIAVKNKPDWVCFVPEKRAELTTEGGLNVVRIEKKLKSYIQKLKKNGIKSSLFIEANLDQVEASARVGAEAVEFHTGHFALASAAGRAKEWPRLKRAALRANLLGLGVHAGHGLDYKSTKQMLRLPHLAELNTGHFLVCESLNVGFYQAVKKMVKIMGAKS
jgi:pyridoxine 5-phosphate synthase